MDIFDACVKFSYVHSDRALEVRFTAFSHDRYGSGKHVQPHPISVKKMKAYWGAWIPALLICGVAHAQSSVTLYGLIDDGIDFTNNARGHSAYQMVSGDVVGSRWGVKGNEDLGGGYSAVFRLENGFNTNTGALGQGGLEFGRQAYVGLSSKDYGTVTFGRQYDPTIDMFSDLTSAGNWAGDFGAHPFDNDNSDWDFRVNNSIKYVSPTFRGFSGEAMYGFSNSTGFADNRLYSAAGQYQMGGLTAAVAYMKIDNPGLNSSGAVTGGSLFSGSSQQDIDAGVSYKFQKMTVGFAYSHTDVYDPTGSAYLTADATQPAGGDWKSWKFDNFEVNAQYYFQPDFWLGGAYTYTRAQLDSSVGNFSPKYHQVSLMLDYDLSPRTSVYIQGAYQHVVSANTGTDFDFAQTPASAGISSTANQVLYRVAMTHRF